MTVQFNDSGMQR